LFWLGSVFFLFSVRLAEYGWGGWFGLVLGPADGDGDGDGDGCMMLLLLAGFCFADTRIRF
jgi:hypothetical protein